MQVKKSFWLGILALILFGCAGIRPGPEVGIHGGIFAQGLYAAYQGDERLGLEGGLIENSLYSNANTDRTIYASTRYYVGTVFLVKLGVAHHSFENEHDKNWYYETAGSYKESAETLGLIVGFGNLWHLKSGIALGCDYGTGYKPLVIVHRQLAANNARYTAAEMRSFERSIMKPSGGLLTFYFGYNL